jgi:hypothetical protein
MKHSFPSLVVVFWLVCLVARAEPPAQQSDGKATDYGEKDALVTLKDIMRMRHDRVPHDQIVDKVAERGLGFEVTATIASQLRRSGFRPAQVDAIKDSPTEPLVPGKGLPTTEKERNQTLREVKTITSNSRVEVTPIQSQHVTLWAAKDIQAIFLPTVEKLEKYFRTKCKEPIRSGLDKRSAHVILLKTRNDYERWIRAMFDLIGDRFESKDNPGAGAEFRASAVKSSAFPGVEFGVICLEDHRLDGAHRNAAACVGFMYFTQLARPRQYGPLSTGFANGAEVIVAGSPSIMLTNTAYREALRNLGADPRAWSVLVKQRMLTNQATPLDKLLKMDTYKMVQPNYAEAWTLLSLLNKQPAKFGKLVLAIRKGTPDLEAIEDVYGWDEEQLTQEWHKHVMGQK